MIALVGFDKKTIGDVFYASVPKDREHARTELRYLKQLIEGVDQ